MSIFKGIAKVALSPLKGVAEVGKDLSGENGESDKGLSILTVGISSLAKGTAKGIEEGVDDIFED